MMQPETTGERAEVQLHCLTSGTTTAAVIQPLRASQLTVELLPGSAWPVGLYNGSLVEVNSREQLFLGEVLTVGPGTLTVHVENVINRGES
jgi:hypothetical protein